MKQRLGGAAPTSPQGKATQTAFCAWLTSKAGEFPFWECTAGAAIRCRAARAREEKSALTDGGANPGENVSQTRNKPKGRNRTGY